MKETIKIGRYFLMIILMVSLVINGCQKDEDEGDAPELPPESALMMDFSTFDQNKAALKSVQTKWHFFQASLTVGIWDIIALAAVYVPATAYAEAFNHDPVYKGNNSWEWVYSVMADQVEISARLVSQRISNEEFTLKFYVSTSGPIQYGQESVTLEDFLWFEGTVKYDRSEAEWTLYEPVNAQEYLAIDWEMNWEADTWMMNYEIINPNDPENGSYIEQGNTNRTDYNAYFTIDYNDNITEIEWETTEYSGRIKAEHSFEDTEWHCWDENQVDILCE